LLTQSFDWMSSGILHIADTYNNRVRKVSNGIITTVAGSGPVSVFGFSGDGGSATSAQLYEPTGVTVDSSGNLYVADWDNSRIRQVSSGVIRTVAGNGARSFGGDGGPAIKAELNLPLGVATDSAGNVYVADTWNNRIRALMPVGTITAVVNAASFQNGPISPGEMVTIGGTGLGPLSPADLTLDQTGKVSTSLEGVQVLFNGMPAPLVYLSATQINCVVPYEVQGIVNPPPGNPAAKGSSMVLYITGEGQTAPPGVTGQVTSVSPASPQTPQPVSPVAVLINGQPASVLFYGEAPGIVSGVMQLNVQIPASAPSGDVSVQVTVGPNATQAGVTISVQ
jgi:hypothetical protein